MRARSRAAAALNKLVEATRRVAHDKGAWRQAASVAARCAAAEAERLTRRAEKAEADAELLRVQVTTLRSGLDSEKARAAKQQALASAAVQAANKRASHFETLYEQAKADASEERRRVEVRAGPRARWRLPQRCLGICRRKINSQPRLNDHSGLSIGGRGLTPAAGV